MDETRPAAAGTRSTTMPSGEVTFLFTDVEGSSALWEADATKMNVALTEHDRRLRLAVESSHGYVFTTAGDSFAVAFRSAGDALSAAVEAQQLLAEPAEGPELRVRMGLHTGSATERDGDYFGPVLNRCARLMSAGHGAQILVSGATAALLSGVLDDEVALIDLGEHRLKDLSRPEHVFQVQYPGCPDTFPTLRTIDAVSSQLPVQLTSFVGRHQEIGEVDKLVRGARLVTLTGSGGAGKTRLALQAAAETVEDYPGGVNLVELGPLTDVDLVVDAVASSVGARPTPGTALEESIRTTIGDRQMLLIFDNCEHLIEPVAALTDHLLSTCAGLKVLATSRERLGVAGEVVYRVPSLALPTDGSDPATANRFDAVRLFAERAALAKPGFAVTSGNVQPVVSICRRLDGIPLALELAAARLAILSPEQIADRLDKRFGLLKGSARGGVARHQTLQATIDWSHDLLDDDERTMFRRASVFAGNFDLEAAEAVAGEDPFERWEVLDLISTLVDKSIVVVEDGPDGEARYRLLESIRQYGAARLTDADEVDSTRSRHLEHYAAYAEVLQVQYRAGELAEAVVRLAEDRDNLRAALDFGLENGHLVAAARIMGSIGYLWYVEGSFREGIEWGERLFAQEPDLPAHVRARALHGYATLLGSWSQPAVGADMLAQEVELRRELGDPARLASALNNLGNLLIDLGRTEESEIALREAVDQFRASGESAAMALSSLAYGHFHRGEYDEAERLSTETLAEARAADDRYGIALAISQLGMAAAQQSRLGEAQARLKEARSLFADLGVAPGVADADFNLGLVSRDVGDHAAAARYLLAALEDPDSHWYLATKFWVLEVSASILEDRHLAVQLLGCAAGHFEGDERAQAVHLLRDFDSTRRALADVLGAEFDTHFRAGAGLDPARAVDRAREALVQLVGNTDSPR